MPSSVPAFAVKSKSCRMASVSFLLHIRKFGALEAACPRCWGLTRPGTRVVSMMSRRPSAQGQLRCCGGQQPAKAGRVQGAGMVSDIKKTHCATLKCPCQSADLNSQCEELKGNEQTQGPLWCTLKCGKKNKVKCLVCVYPFRITLSPMANCAP